MKKQALLITILLVTELLYAQQSFPLDQAIFTAGRYLNMRIPSRARVAVLNFIAPSKALSDYVTAELAYALSRNPMLTLVEHSGYPQVGEAMLDAALPIGKKLAVLVLVLGSIISSSTEPDSFILQIRAISVQNAQTYWAGTYPLIPDQTLMRLQYTN
jgi:TolB-like protein